MITAKIVAPYDSMIQVAGIVMQMNSTNGTRARDACRSIVEVAVIAMPEIAWLIESTFYGPSRWWGFREGFDETFTSDPNRAVRFARREDAERAIALLGGHMMKATEHAWVNR